MKKRGSGGLVYSTSHGRMCPECRRPAEECHCRKLQSAPAGNGVVRVGRETKGRKGAGVTVITGVPLAADELAALAGQLKRLCGAGGTVHQGTIEIQGDHRDRVIEALRRPGWTIKRVGG